MLMIEQIFTRKNAHSNNLTVCFVRVGTKNRKQIIFGVTVSVSVAAPVVINSTEQARLSPLM
jgi:hypothetical protein